MTLAPEELDRLIGEYAGGTLEAADAARLIATLKEHPEARERLAQAVATERLLRAEGRGAVPVERIMAAVAAGKAPARAGKAPWRSSRLALALALLAALGLAGWAALRFQAAPSTPIATSAARPMVSVKENKATPVSPTPRSATHAPPAAAVSVYSALPFEVPPPLPGASPAEPSGDGRDEPGFVAPPEGWLGRPASTPQTPLKSASPAPPLLWVKLHDERRPDWATTPEDLPSLLQHVRTRLNLSYGTAVRTLEEVDADAAQNPILYFTGYYHFTFTAAQRAVLRRLLLSGGTIVFDAGLGSKPFYDSACRELRRIFPEVELQRLRPDHPLLHAYYDLERVAYCDGVRKAGYAEEAPWLDGLTLSCRTAAVVSRWGLAAGWEGQEEAGYRAYAAEDARRLGVNLSAYALAARAWARRAGPPAPPAAAGAPRGSQVCVAQVIHDAEWLTRRQALPLLLDSFNRRTDVPVGFRAEAMRLTSPAIFDAPLLYLTGHDALNLGRAEADALRQYLKNGGFLLAESCCGRAGFDRVFRELVERLFPGQPLAAVPEDSPLFRAPNRIDLLRVTPSLAARRGSPLMRPRLEGLKIGGQYAILYSPYGLAGGWEGTPAPYADGYEDSDALKLGQNILMYAVTE